MVYKLLDINLSGKRDLDLDFVKGVLVVTMVLYHIMNYFSTANAKDFEPIRFVSGSFIFISGYIVATFYEARYQIDFKKASSRLLIRGMKLLIIFTILNIIINLTGIRNPSKVSMDLIQFVKNFTKIYVLGTPRIAAFQILLPIAYILLITPLLFLLSKKNYLLLILILILYSFILLSGINSVNLNLGIIGIIGLYCGIIKNNTVIEFSIQNRIIIFGFLFACFFLMEYFNKDIMSYSIGIMFILKLFYDLSKTIKKNNIIYQIIIMFGQYTLVCYIVQIIFLQGLQRIFSLQRLGLSYQNILLFLVTVLFLLIFCIFVDILRKQYKPLNKSYRFVFL